MNDRAKRVVEITARDGDQFPEGGDTTTPEGALVVVKWAAPSLTDAEAEAVRDFLMGNDVDTSPEAFSAAVYDVLGPDVEVRTPEYYDRVTLGGVTAPPSPDPVAERRAREAPLVALVAAVPSWADPVAWRAAVLALVDMCTIKNRYTLPDVWPSMQDAVMGALRSYVDGKTARPENPWSPAEVAAIAYARALAPSAAVRPEWRERLPHGLACNAHEVP